MEREVFIVSAARTPIGAFSGSLSTISATKLGAIAIKNAVERAGIKPEDVQEVFMGNVLTANEGQAPARQAALFAGLSNHTACTTINKVCASGAKSIIFAAQTILLGDNDIVVAGGMESMSNVPYYLDKAREGYRLGHAQVIDGVIKDGLWDVYNDYHMGSAAEHCAASLKITREAQDAYAVESYKRAAKAFEEGKFKDEIVPVEVAGKKETITVTEDEDYKKVIYEKIPGLRPSFQKDGTITAANASNLNDGASALVLMSGEKMHALGLKPLAKVIAYADNALAPEDFPIAPVGALKKALGKAGKRTYFFDVKATRANDYYVTITESKRKQDGYGYDKHKIFLYKEDFNKFMAGLGEVVNHIKNDLMPGYDFEKYDQVESEGDADDHDDFASGFENIGSFDSLKANVEVEKAIEFKQDSE